jgi:hypothetical protein
MQDLDPTQYDEAVAGGWRRADRLLVREKPCRPWLSKIICAVIFYESLSKPRLRLRRAPVDSSHEAAIRSNFRLPIVSTALGSSLGTPWTILSQGNRYADDDH